MLEILITVIIAFSFGIVVGSFLNVCIYRIPQKETIVSQRSHCMNCGSALKWYELIPLFSFLILKGNCGHCKEKISWQYPLVELANGILWVWVSLVFGLTLESLLVCLCASTLVVISAIDLKTFEIPIGCNFFIALLGITRTAVDLAHWYDHVIGFFVVSGFFYILYIATKKRGMGGGDIKLMAAAGLFLGWENCILAMVIGCIVGSVIHLMRMKISKKESVLAFGPYLSIGIFIAMLYGDMIIKCYLETVL